MRRKKHSNKGRRIEEKEEEHRTLPAPGGRSYGMARQCPRGHSSCKARVVAGVTPTNTTTAAQHGDDGTGAASSTRARSVSEALTSMARARARRSFTIARGDSPVDPDRGDPPGEDEERKTARTDR
jgi:hypothetical protein